MVTPTGGVSSFEAGLRTLSTLAFVAAVAIGLAGRTVIAVLLGVAAIVLGIASALVTRDRADPTDAPSLHRRR